MSYLWLAPVLFRGAFVKPGDEPARREETAQAKSCPLWTKTLEPKQQGWCCCALLVASDRVRRLGRLAHTYSPDCL